MAVYREQYSGAVFNDVLAFLGLTASFNALSSDLKSYIRNSISCKIPRVSFGSSLKKFSKQDRKVKELVQHLTFDGTVYRNSTKFKLDHLLTVGLTFHNFVRYLSNHPSLDDKELKAFANKAWSIIEENSLTSLFSDLNKLFFPIELSLLAGSSVREYLYYINIEGSIRNLKIQLNKELIQSVKLNLDREYGGNRKAYPIRFAYCDKLVGPVVDTSNWDDERLNKHDAWEMYIQEHTIRRMEDRLSVRGTVIPFYVGWIETFLEPKKIKNKNLIPFTMFNTRLGYFSYDVVEAQKIIVLTTFLTPVMSGTPESDELYKRVGITNQDSRYLGLDNIETLINSDLMKDPSTKAIFEDCGLTDPDLFRRYFEFNIPKLEIAEHFKRHICLKDNP